MHLHGHTFTVITFSITSMLVVTVTGVPKGQGYSDNNDEHWAYTWYEGEPFYLLCNSSKLNVQLGEYVIWETPSKHILNGTGPYTDYEVRTMNGVPGGELNIKSVREELHGVYICRVYNSTTGVYQRRTVLALNYHEAKYRDLNDKYRHNVVKAVITTCVFTIPLATIYVVFHFQYRTPEEKDLRRVKKKGTRKFMYSATETMKYEENKINYRSEPGEKGSHDNPTFTTEL